LHAGCGEVYIEEGDAGEAMLEESAGTFERQRACSSGDCGRDVSVVVVRAFLLRGLPGCLPVIASRRGILFRETS